jgi:3-hydroxybutyryl-CoA dehydrogenase
MKDIEQTTNAPLAIIGAGTMGSGIALAGLLAGLRVILYDVDPAMPDKGRDTIRTHLARKGREDALARLTLTHRLEDVRSARVVIEAAPEDLSLKRDVFRRLDALCPPPAALASNTSTLSITAIASAVQTPQRVAGMHFFNPAPVMPLVEIGRGARTDDATLQALVRLAEAMGKTPLVARDTPGFIVNRVARPFYGEALGLLGEGVASHLEIDWAVRLGSGFRMGPFQLVDLIGIDINFAATRSMYEQTFGEPRYRPHWIQQQMVAQGALGRKTGRGFYDYSPDAPPREPPEPPEMAAASGQVLVSRGSWAPGLAELCRAAGYLVTGEPEAAPAAGLLVASRCEGLQERARHMEEELPPGTPLLCQAADVTVGEIAGWVECPQRLVGFDGLFAARGRLVTLVASPVLADDIRAAAEAFFTGLGRSVLWIADSPGLILPRIAAMLANEAAFAVGEGVADAETVDLAMRLGANYPQGPLAWAKEIGYERVVDVLDHLRTEFGSERYRVAPLLRRWARGESLRHQE